MGPKPKCSEQNCYPTKESLKSLSLKSLKNFLSKDSNSSGLFKSNHILKLEDKILIENIRFINKLINNLLLPIIRSWFTFCSDVQLSNGLIYY